jgi:hypothetical protein
LIDQAFATLALIGAKEVYIPVIGHTQLGNEHSMVRWIKQVDGSYKYDFSIAEKYLDTALKHLGTIPLVGVYVEDKNWGDATPAYPVTELDPATGELKEFNPPKFGTQESQAFWKPVIDGLQRILVKRGLEKAMYFGYGCQGFGKDKIADFKVLAPNVKWINVTHSSNIPEVGQQTLVNSGVLAVFWDPETDKPHYGWTSKDPVIRLCSPRGKVSPQMTTSSQLSMYRLCAEGAYLCSAWDPFVVGMGHVGGDFWPVLKSLDGKTVKRVEERFAGWGSLNMMSVIAQIIGAGKDGPVPTTRLRMMQESIQESEVRVFVQNALLDETAKAKLGPDLAKRASELCNERTRMFRYCSAFFGDFGTDYGRMINAGEWQADSEKLFKMADEIQTVLGK